MPVAPIPNTAGPYDTRPGEEGILMPKFGTNGACIIWGLTFIITGGGDGGIELGVKCIRVGLLLLFLIPDIPLFGIMRGLLAIFLLSRVEGDCLLISLIVV